MLLELSGDARDRPAGYDGALRMLHWSTALLIGVNVALGFGDGVDVSPGVADGG